MILYGGKYGRNNDIPTMLRAVERLADRDDLQFVFIGYGFLEPEVLEAAARLPNMTALPALPKHQMFPWFELADLTLFSVVGVPSLGTASPSKVFDSLGAGTPIVMISPGWATDLVVRENVGFATPTGESDALATVIEEAFADPEALKAMGERGLALAVRDFDRRDHVRRLEAVFEAVVARKPVTPYVAEVDRQLADEKAERLVASARSYGLAQRCGTRLCRGFTSGPHLRERGCAEAPERRGFPYAGFTVFACNPACQVT